MRWGERELAQLIRRKMLCKSERNKKKYNRKQKHKNIKTINGKRCVEIEIKAQHPATRQSCGVLGL